MSGTNTGVYYVLSDHLGSSSLTTNSFGNMIDRTEYYPYGSVAATASNQDIGNHYKFTGKEQDSENGLQYFGARYYDNRVGKFTAIDPYGLQIDKIVKVLSDPQQLNGYSYSRNNPIILVDADGNTPAEYLGGYVVGLGQSVGNFAVGTVESIVHPVEAVKSIGNTLKAGGEGAVSLVRDIAANPKQVASEIKAGASMSYNEFMDKPDSEKGKIIGNAVGNAAIAVEGMGKAKGLEPYKEGLSVGVKGERFGVSVDLFSKAKGAGVSIRDFAKSAESYYDTRAIGIDLHNIKTFGKELKLPHIDINIGDIKIKHWPWPKK